MSERFGIILVRIKVIIIVSFVILLFVPFYACASEVVLKSGEKIEGKIIEQTNKYIKIDTGINMPVTYYSDEIDTVDGQKMGQQKGPIVIPITADDVFDTASMDFTGPYLWFFAKNRRCPQTSDWEEFKAIARQMTPPVDLDKYTDIDMAEQPDGSVKVKYRLKSKSVGSEFTLQKPTPK